MKTANSIGINLLQVWEDIVNDFLEMACFLRKEDRHFVLEEIERNGLQAQAESIEVHACFSIEGRYIVICEQVLPRECWIFSTRSKSFRCWKETER